MQLNLIRRFVLHGVDVNRQDYDGRTVLHIACSNNHCDIVQFLLNNCRIEVDVKDRFVFNDNLSNLILCKSVVDGSALLCMMQNFLVLRIV